MTESMIVEAIRAARGTGMDPAVQMQSIEKTADPSAVERFQAAMGAPGVGESQAIPFVSEVGKAWDSAKTQNQALLHRIRALSELSSMNSASAQNLIELQYQVMNLAFQQDVVTKIADKASSAIQTLIKNQ